MVKRQKSQETVEESRFFTICQPFPLNVNWLFEQDRRECAAWIAECIGPDMIEAFLYRPSSRGMVLLEIKKDFVNHEWLLGEHRWSEMLTEPSAEEENRVSRIFYCFYSAGRDAEKDGWRNIPIGKDWFDNWSPGTGPFKRPYPQTYWCPVPPEDRTNKQLCRPLPAYIKPPPPRVKQPVVGSASWASTKNATASTSRAWDEDVDSIDLASKFIDPVQPRQNSGSNVVFGQSPAAYPPLARIAASSVPNKGQPSSNNASSRNDRKKKFVPLNQARSPLNGASPKPAPRPANAWEKRLQLPVPSVPVAPVKKETALEDLSSWGLESATPTVDQDSIWNSRLPNKKSSKKANGHTGTIPETPASSRPSPWSTQPSSSSASSTSRNVPPPYPKFQFSADSEEGNSDAEDIYVPMSHMTFTHFDDLPPEELEYAHVSAWERGYADALEPGTSQGANEGRTYENLWASGEDPRAVPLPELVCPTHQIACSKGICEDMAMLIRAKKRKEQEAKWEQDSKNKKKKGKGRKENDGDSNSGGNSGEVNGDGFTVARQGKRKAFGKQKRAQDTPSGSGTAGGSSTNASNNVSETEGQIFSQW
ncbi:hypothetical protein BYT27DRAFT_7188409 [Phlegmacium glaucopus]|nr:hypothetical protein BYT27DRAFT_7188409 [Phlegmacium glaucopus]